MALAVQSIRLATLDDADAVAAIYAPVVRDTCISFEFTPPSAEEMSARIAKTLPILPWLVWDDAGTTLGYAYASRHRERAAYQWSVDVSAYVHPEARRRGIGKALYRQLFRLLELQGYQNAYAGITLPNAASVALHESVGMTSIGIYRHVGFKMGAWRDVGWWERTLGELMTDPEPPRALAQFTGSAELLSILSDAS